MSSSSWRMVSRLSSRVAAVSKPVPAAASTSTSSLFKSTPTRFSLISRLPVELSGMLPLHTAIATARLTSRLSAESQAWGLVPQGISMPL